MTKLLLYLPFSDSQHEETLLNEQNSTLHPAILLLNQYLLSR